MKIQTRRTWYAIRHNPVLIGILFGSAIASPLYLPRSAIKLIFALIVLVACILLGMLGWDEFKQAWKRYGDNDP